MKNLKTTMAGIVMILFAVATLIKGLIDDDPLTPDYNIIIGGIVGGVGLIVAKDFDTTGVGINAKKEKDL